LCGREILYKYKETNYMETSEPSKIYISIRSKLSRIDWRAWLPSRGNVLFTLVIVFALLWAQSAHALPGMNQPAVAASTGIWPYQGRLADSAGAPLTAALPMTFKLYNAASGGTALWQEQWTSVQVNAGLFNVMLGSLTPIPPSIVSGNSNLWLGIAVGADSEMTPRVQLGSAPYAAQALTVPDGSIGTLKLADGSVTQAKLGPGISFVPQDGSFLQIQSGYMNVDSVTTPEWTLATNTPGTDAVYMAHVTFSQSFATVPTILMALNKLDSDSSANTRVNIYPANITTTGFDMVFQTWHTSIVYGMAASWIAYSNQ
jgi:hypothetical protein